MVCTVRVRYEIHIWYLTITLARIVLQQLATEAKPRTKLIDYRDRSRQLRQHTLGKSIIRRVGKVTSQN